MTGPLADYQPFRVSPPALTVACRKHNRLIVAEGPSDHHREDVAMNSKDDNEDTTNDNHGRGGNDGEGGASGPGGQHLHIFVNRIKFEESDGVKPIMTVAEIAALAKVTADNAIVRFETGPNKDPLDPAVPIEIKNGQHFLVTRKVVDGGCG